jgi:magnesium chelatase subunit D
MWALGEVIKKLATQSPKISESEVSKIPTIIAEKYELTPMQIKLLQQICNSFGCYASQFEEFIEFLKFNSNKQIEETGKQDVSSLQHNEMLSLKSLAKLLLGRLKLKHKCRTNTKNIPKYRTIFENRKENHEEGKKFSIDLEDLHKIRLNFAKREKTSRIFRRNNLLENGKIINYTNEKQGKKIQIVPTILQTIKNRHFSLPNKQLRIHKSDFLYPVYQQSKIYNIMLVVDTSKSISWLIPHIQKVISNITANIVVSKDRLGLITFSNNNAKILHYPTMNIKQVIGSINKHKAKGETPLGDGLNLAVQIFNKDQYKLAGMKNIIILISDCFPEPIEGGYKNLLNEPSYKKVVQACRKIKKEQISFIIINPGRKHENKAGWNIKLIDKMLEVTQARYIEFEPKIKYNIFQGEKTVIEDGKIQKLTQAIYEMKLNR